MENCRLQLTVDCESLLLLLLIWTWHYKLHQQLAATKQLVANNSGLLGRWNETEPRPRGWMMSVSVHRRVCTAPSVLITDVRCHLVTSTGSPALILTLITRDISEISREFYQCPLMINFINCHQRMI